MKFKPLVVLLVVATSCASSEQTSTGQSIGCELGEVIEGRPLNIATTVAPITSIVANIAGGTASVITGVVPEGTNSHTFEPRPSDAATLESADIIFINGLVLEEPTKDLALANIKPSANICELGSEILPESEYIYDFSFPKEGGKPNPHLWTNPPMAKQYAQVVRDVLVRRDPSNAAIYDKNFVAFAVKIDALDNAIKIATATIPEDQRKLLTYHDAYAYFARDFGWTVIGAVQPRSFAEPTPAEVAALIEQVKAAGVPTIFGSEVFPSAVLEEIGRAAKVMYNPSLRDDDLPGRPGEPEHSWFGLMKYDYTTMIKGLGGTTTNLDALSVGPTLPDTANYPQ